MNTEIIEVETPSLEGGVNELKTALDNMKKHVTEVYEGVQELDAMWDGPANEAFVKQFTDDYNACMELYEELAELVECMRYAREEYDRCEQSVGSLIDGITI